MADGRVITGLPVEETAERLVLKTADGERVAIPTGSIEERRTSDVSLMPDGLAQTLTESELVDLIAYLTRSASRSPSPGNTMSWGRSPSRWMRRGSTRRRRSTSMPTVDDGHGRKLSWRRVNANAEGLVDLSALVGSDAKTEACAYIYAPLISPVAQTARLVLDTPAGAAAWVNGKPVTLSATGSDKGGPRIRRARASPGGPGRC